MAELMMSLNAFFIGKIPLPEGLSDCMMTFSSCRAIWHFINID
jgi:hypothetical protein